MTPSVTNASVSDLKGLEDVDAILDCDGFELARVDITKTSVSPHIAHILGQRKVVFLCRKMAITILKGHELKGHDLQECFFLRCQQST